MTCLRLRGPDGGCRNCGTVLTAQNWSKGLRDHRRYWCNPCYAKRQKTYYQNDPNGAAKRLANKKRLQRSWDKSRREEERRKSYARALKKRYGISSADFYSMLDRQDNKCFICFDHLHPVGGRGFNQVHIDHCHATGMVRSILCGHCNRMLGMAKENAATLRRAADYILAFRASSVRLG